MARTASSFRMWTQIQSQSDELARLLDADEPIADAAVLLGNAERVFTVGTGTSSNAASSAATMLRRAEVDAIAWAAHDFDHYGPTRRPGDAALVFSHTGRKQFTRDALAAFAAAGVPTVWIASTEAEANPATVTLRTVARETSSAFTVSHTSAMLLTARLADAVAPGCVGTLADVPPAVTTALASEPALAALANAWRDRASFVAVGAGPQEPSAHEVAIKINEAARMRARGYAVEQFLHGPQAQMQSDDALIVFAAVGAGFDRSRAVAQFGLDIGLPVAWISPEPAPAGATAVPVPDVGEWLAPIVQAIPGQLLAAHLAALQDVDADNFRLDDPPFKRAFERYDL